MRLVVDTNVFVSAALKGTSWPAATLRWIARYGGLLKSIDTEAELLNVLQRPRIASKMDPAFPSQVRQLLGAAMLVTISERVRVCRDPEDDMFLELAVSGQADAIVSGDADLLALDTFRDIPIITPAAFRHRCDKSALSRSSRPALWSKGSRHRDRPKDGGAAVAAQQQTG